MCDTWSLTFDPVTSKSTLLIYYPGWMCDESRMDVRRKFEDGTLKFLSY